MKNKLAWLFSTFMLFLGLMTIDTNASAATKNNAQNYVLKNSLFQAITYEATDLKLCDKKKGMLYWGNSKVLGGKGWICTNNDSMFIYDVYKKNLIMGAAGTDWIIVDEKFPLKEGIYNESYYDEWNEKTIYYKTKIKFKKTLKTKCLLQNKSADLCKEFVQSPALFLCIKKKTCQPPQVPLLF